MTFTKMKLIDPIKQLINTIIGLFATCKITINNK